MKTMTRHQTYWLIGLLGLLSLLTILKGCERHDSSNSGVAPGNIETRTIVLTFAGGANPAAKTAGLKIDIIGLNEEGLPKGPVLDPIEFSDPAFPLQVPVTLYIPPCSYRFTVTASLTENPARSKSIDVDICEWTGGELSIDTYENYQVGQMTIDAPDPVEAGANISVSCRIAELNAPDIQRYPPLLLFSEIGGRTIYERLNLAKQAGASKITYNAGLSGDFYDPYPTSSQETQRVFTCTLDDGKSTPVTVTKTIRRTVVPATPTPTPTPTPIGTPVCTLPDCPDGIYECPPDQGGCPGGCGLVCASSTPVPAGTSTPVSAGTSTPTPTATPTPLTGCVVGNENDSGTDSLRDVISLINAGTISCSTVSFATGVTDILLTDNDIRITTGNPLTIDGGSGVIISGNSNHRIFTIVSGVDVTLLNLTIRDGSRPFGGGIRNDGTATIGDGTIIRNNGSSIGGGIYNSSGTLTVTSGAIIGGPTAAYANTGGDGGGINNNGGTVTIYGTVSNNTAGSGGGIDNGGSGGILKLYGTVDNNRVNGGSGGGIVNSATAIIYGTAAISNNQTLVGGGGGLANVGGGTLTVQSGATINGNTAIGNGGGIANISGSANIENGVTISNNSADCYGGGVDSTDGLTVSGTVSNNRVLVSGSCAGTGGGGIAVRFVGAQLDGLVEGNTAPNGGGIYVTSTCSITATVRNNQADFGGGIYAFGVMPFDATVEGNTATTEGGGLYISGGVVGFGGSHVIQGNTAPAGSGGGIYNDGGTMNGVSRNYGTGNTGGDCAGSGCP